MSWIAEHKKKWRVAVLVLLPVALVGPWWFDRISVPAEYTCSPPNYRLEGDFCGVPVTGLWFFRWGIPGFVYASWELIVGEMAFIDWFRGLLVGLLTLLLALPFITTLLLILRGDRRRRHVLAVAALHPGADVGNGQKRPPNGRPAEKAVSNRASH